MWSVVFSYFACFCCIWSKLIFVGWDFQNHRQN